MSWTVVFFSTTDSFEVSVGDELVFSKLETQVFPDAEQVCASFYFSSYC